LGAAAPQRTADRLSARYLIALGARMVREVGAFAEDLTAAVARVIARTVCTAGHGDRTDLPRAPRTGPATRL
jgi:hypothetical protein